VVTSFDEIYATHYRAVLAYLQQRAPSVEQAEDLATDTFIHAWRAWSRYRDHQKPRAFLLRIARNVLIDWIRSQDRRLNAQFLTDAQAHDLAQPEIELDPQATWVRTALAQLPPKQQRVIDLTMQGYSDLEIAERLGEANRPDPTINVRQLKFRAIRSLRHMRYGHSAPPHAA
jgi:RNA polymerase sigma factor (sigma-70 family)